MSNANPSFDLPRILLGIIFLLLLLAATFWILKPFLLPLVWAAMIVISTWPLLLELEKRLRGRRHLAVAVMTLSQLLVLILPLTLAVNTIFSNIDLIKGWVWQVAAEGFPPPPAWVDELPLIGSKAAEMWREAAIAGPEGLSASLVPYANKALAWFVNNAGGVGLVFVQFLLTLIISAILYAKGEIAANGVRRFFRRLAGDNGEQAVLLGARAIRAVAMGIVVTALIQSLLGGIGLWVAGIPAVTIITAVMFLLAIAQVGVVPVMAIAVAWLFWKGTTLWAVVLLVWTLIVGSIDNILRPLLIRRGADLPLLLILAGVLGGLVAFGIIGLFVGPVVLAVSYTLTKAWIAQGEAAEQAKSCE